MKIHSRAHGRAHAGETLTETLCAMLVIALASVLLVTMLMVGMRLNRDAMQQDARFYDEVNAIEQRTSPSAPARVTVDASGTSYPLDVTVYGSADGLRSYRKAGS